MNVLLIQIDGKMPNLALMKLAAWHEARGDRVVLNGKLPIIDKVYISCIFTENKSLALGIAKMFSCQVEIGGSGVDLKSTLKDEIEHQKPDYSLYGIKYSMGYTSRGCIRKCPWCIIPEKEGYIRDNAPLSEFYVPSWHKLILFDNNFLASPKWHENLREIIIRKIRVSFFQGLDIRLVDNEVATLLAKTHYSDKKFTTPRLYFAWDTPNIESKVLEGIETLRKVGIKPQHLMFYILTNYNTTLEQDIYRAETLINLNIKPYIMIYNKPTAPKPLKHYRRYINGRYYKIIQWTNYKP